MPVPTTGTFKMFDSEETSNPINSSIKGAQIYDASDPVTNVNNFAGLISSAQVSLFNPIYSGTITSLSDISSSLQFRDYPLNTPTTTISNIEFVSIFSMLQLDITVNNNSGSNPLQYSIQFSPNGGTSWVGIGTYTFSGTTYTRTDEESVPYNNDPKWFRIYDTTNGVYSEIYEYSN